MTRVPFVLGNWKMNPASLGEAVALARAVAALPTAAVEVGVAPPAIALAAVADALRGSAVAVYAQDVHWERTGAYTGALSASMLEGIAVGTIVGHSEVRRDLGDDDARVAAKVARALGSGLRVVLCVGETVEIERASALEIVTRQVSADLARAPRDSLSRLAIAYEPIWAIGTGHPATGAHAAAAAAAIRIALAAAGADPDETHVLYGGSVTAAGVAEFAGAEGIDGALVGGASLKPDDFGRIVQAFAR